MNRTVTVDRERACLIAWRRASLGRAERALLARGFMPKPGRPRQPLLVRRHEDIKVQTDVARGLDPPGGTVVKHDSGVRRPNGALRIALTGGPGGGKTTGADFYRREIGERVVVVPEAATLLFSGGFPRSPEAHARRAAQTAIFHVQRNLEKVQAALYPDRVLLCDRGTVDGAVFWPSPPEDFFTELGTSLEAELRRYDAVIFFETAAASGQSIEGGNPVRTESLEEAVAIDRELRALWSHHPQFRLVPHDRSFLKKLTTGLAMLESLVAQLAHE